MSAETRTPGSTTSRRDYAAGVALSAERVELGVGERERFVRCESVLCVPLPDLIHLEAEVTTERVLDDLRLVTP